MRPTYKTVAGEAIMKKRAALTGQVSDFDLRLLRVFKTVVDCGGISAAEVELKVSRSAISTSIADLEKRLGMRLCQRGRAGFSVTQEGRETYRAVLQLLASLEGFKTQINAIQDELRGEFNIGIMDSLATMYRSMRITDSLTRLKQLGPEVSINLSMNAPSEIERAVLDGRLHVGVVKHSKPFPGLEYCPLYQEQSRLYCGHKHPLFNAAQQDLNPEQVVSHEAVMSAYVQAVDVKAINEQLRGHATASTREAAAFLILTGCFIGYLPTHMAERWVDEGRMRELLPEHFHFETKYSAIVHKGAAPHLVRDTFMDELRKTEPAT